MYIDRRNYTKLLASSDLQIIYDQLCMVAFGGLHAVNRFSL